MSISLKGRHFLTLKDFTREEILYLLDLSAELKSKKKKGITGQSLQGKNIVIIFEKTSTRTRCAFEVAVYDEGGRVTFLTNSQMGKKESVEDTAKVLGRFYDGIEFRGFKQETVNELAKYSGVPVWNGLTDLYHPTQILADFLTAQEHTGKKLEDTKFAFVGDGRFNMANSFLIGCAKMGSDISIVAPKELLPQGKIVEEVQAMAAETGARILLTDDISQGVKDADVVYTDVWFSMGEEDQMEERIRQLMPYQVNSALMEKTGNPKALFMHCLPAFHDQETEVGRMVFEKFGISEMEVTDGVFRSSQSVVFDEAENRMHTIKAVMVATAGLEEL